MSDKRLLKKTVVTTEEYIESPAEQDELEGGVEYDVEADDDADEADEDRPAKAGKAKRK